MKRVIMFLKENRYAIIALGLVFIIIVLFMCMSITCPIKYLTGISCPGCGMTRAFLCLFKLDFASAFYYNPSWILLVITALLLLVFKIKNIKRAQNITLAVFAVLVFGVYFYRMCSPDDTIVVFCPKAGMLYQLFNFTP